LDDDVIKDVLYLTMLMCFMLSPGLLNPDVSCMFSLILIKRRPLIPIVGLNLTITTLRHNITKTKLLYPNVS